MVYQSALRAYLTAQGIGAVVPLRWSDIDPHETHHTLLPLLYALADSVGEPWPGAPSSKLVFPSPVDPQAEADPYWLQALSVAPPMGNLDVRYAYYLWLLDSNQQPIVLSLAPNPSLHPLWAAWRASLRVTTRTMPPTRPVARPVLLRRVRPRKAPLSPLVPLRRVVPPPPTNPTQGPTHPPISQDSVYRRPARRAQAHSPLPPAEPEEDVELLMAPPTAIATEEIACGNFHRSETPWECVEHFNRIVDLDWTIPELIAIARAARPLASRSNLQGILWEDLQAPLYRQVVEGLLRVYSQHRLWQGPIDLRTPVFPYSPCAYHGMTSKEIRNVFTLEGRLQAYG